MHSNPHNTHTRAAIFFPLRTQALESFQIIRGRIIISDSTLASVSRGDKWHDLPGQPVTIATFTQEPF